MDGTILPELRTKIEGMANEEDMASLARFSSVKSLTFVDYPLLDQASIAKADVRDVIVRHVRTLLQEKKFVVRDVHKLINDPIHGTVYVHPLAILIMNTPQFQRLHYIRQLASLHYVYPSAAYSRFEHSVGVYHLAGKLVNILKDNQPELGITAIDAMCVQLAGLCHDLGHGPFSHMFDRGVIPALDPKTKWTHEDASIALLDHIYYRTEHVRQGFHEWGFSDKDFEFVKSLINCKTDEGKTGRGESKSFLYEIVANDRSGMDVDKWDFLIRDSFHLGIKCGFDHDRLMYHLRVITVDGEPQICVRDKEADTVYSMFYTRSDLYKKAYQHPVSMGVELLIAEAIIKAGEQLKVGGKSLLECLDDMEAYTKLHDGIFFKILDSEGDDLKESRELLERLQKRKLWKFVGQVRTSADPEKCKEIGKEMESELREATGLNFRSQVNRRNFGKGDYNSLDYVRFYKKNNPTEACPLTFEQRLYILPKEFRHTFLAIYCMSHDVPKEVFEKVEQLFRDKGLCDAEKTLSSEQ